MLLACRGHTQCVELWESYLYHNIPAAVIFVLIALAERRQGDPDLQTCRESALETELTSQEEGEQRQRVLDCIWRRLTTCAT